MMKQVLALIFAVMFAVIFVSPLARADESTPSLKKQTAISSWMATELNKRPASKDFIKMLTSKLRDSDRTAVPKIIDSLQKSDSNIHFTSNLGDLNAFQGDTLLVSLRVKKTNPFTILVDGTDEIQIDKNGVVQSVAKYFNRKVKSAHMRIERTNSIAQLLLPQAYAGTATMIIGDLPGIQKVMTVYAAGQLSQIQMTDSLLTAVPGATSDIQAVFQSKDMTCKDGEVSGVVNVDGKSGYKFATQGQDLILTPPGSEKPYRMHLQPMTSDASNAPDSVDPYLAAAVFGDPALSWGEKSASASILNFDGHPGVPMVLKSKFDQRKFQSTLLEDYGVEYYENPIDPNNDVDPITELQIQLQDKADACVVKKQNSKEYINAFGNEQRDKLIDKYGPECDAEVDRDFAKHALQVFEQQTGAKFAATWIPIQSCDQKNVCTPASPLDALGLKSTDDALNATVVSIQKKIRQLQDKYRSLNNGKALSLVHTQGDYKIEGGSAATGHTLMTFRTEMQPLVDSLEKAQKAAQAALKADPKSDVNLRKAKEPVLVKEYLTLQALRQCCGDDNCKADMSLNHINLRPESGNTVQ